jgi:uncharacterized protein (DUF2062 family)
VKRIDVFVNKVLAFFPYNGYRAIVAATVAFAFLAALFPIIGPVTAIVLLICWVFRLNIPLVLLILYGLYPLQLALIVPFTLFGGRILGRELPTSSQLTAQLSELNLVGSLFYELGLSAIVGWITICLPISLTLFFILKKFKA